MAGFPAGTLSGAPKVRAMQIIDELEKEKRGPYGGCVGYFSADGEMDSCIVLRTALVKDGMIYVQAGAGIVADSDPHAEQLECQYKARALFKAAEEAVRFAAGPSAATGNDPTFAPARLLRCSEVTRVSPRSRDADTFSPASRQVELGRCRARGFRPAARQARESRCPTHGRFHAGAGLEPDLILCSTAVRARQTLDLVLPRLPGAPQVVHEEGLYLAPLPVLLAARAQARAPGPPCAC